jgi:methanogenic corrinoid protein MtbC1
MTAAETIRATLDQTAAAIAARHFARHAEALARYGEMGRQRCLEDARFHLQYLATALEAESDALFLDYVGWAKVVLAQRHVPERDLAENLAIVEEFVPDPEAKRIVRLAIDALPSMSSDVASMLDPRAPHWSVASSYLTELLAGNRRGAQQVVVAALESGVPLRDVYRHVFETAQQEIGRLWQLNQISVAQEHFCTAATQQIMAQLYGRMFTGANQTRRAIAMCVGGELHEIGLRIVTDLLELEGWQTWYLGASVPPAAAIQLCVDHRADVLLISATLPPHIAQVREAIGLVRGRSELDAMKIVVGGRAFRTTPGLWRTIGADGYAGTFDECLAVLGELVPA